MLAKSDIEMPAKGHLEMTANPLVTDAGYSIDAAHWRTAIVLIIALFLGILLVTQLGKAVRLEKGAEIALSRARQLLHDAEKENRNVRPLPLSLAELQLYAKLA
jgi:hypothetical protein